MTLKKIIKSKFRSLRLLHSRFMGHNKFKIGKGNNIDLANSLFYNCKIKVNGRGNIIKIQGENSFYNCSINIFGNNSVIEIGQDNLFREVTFWLEDEDTKIIIGNNNKFCGKLDLGSVEGTSIIIGDNCLFSSDIHITTTDSHSILDKNSQKRINHSKSIEIEDHVWIGTRVSILKGVKIVHDVVVGAGSLITKSIGDSNCAVAGIPAKIVKRDIEWKEERI